MRGVASGLTVALANELTFRVYGLLIDLSAVRRVQFQGRIHSFILANGGTTFMSSLHPTGTPDRGS